MQCVCVFVQYGQLQLSNATGSSKLVGVCVIGTPQAPPVCHITGRIITLPLCPTLYIFCLFALSHFTSATLRY